MIVGPGAVDELRRIVRVLGIGERGRTVADRCRAQSSDRGPPIVEDAAGRVRAGRLRAGVDILVWSPSDPLERDEQRALSDWQRETDGVAVGVRLAPGGPMQDSHPTIDLPAMADQDELATRAVDCLAALLVGPSLVNLRVHELREVLAQGRTPVFLASARMGAGDPQILVRDWAAQWRASHGASPPRAIWAQVATREGLDLSATRAVAQALRSWLADRAVCWVGGTRLLRDDRAVMRLSAIAAR